MKRLFLLLSVSVLIAGCFDFTNIDTEESSIESEQTTSEVVDERQKFLNSLPEDSSSDDWNLILVNPEVPLPSDFEADLVEVDNEQIIDERIVDAWEAMRDSATADGHELFFASGYRSIELQANNFENEYQEQLSMGLSEEEALEETKGFLTEPEHSEHHTGLALDIVDGPWIVAGNGLEQEYETQESFDWLMDNIADYGFILRYPQDKVDVTMINYEPWHFRYVGIENAKFMEEHNLALEEYVALLEERESQNETN